MPAPPTVFDRRTPDFDSRAVLDCLAGRGFVVLRNMFPAASLDHTVEAAAEFAHAPAIAGVPGYSKVDHPKKLFNPLLLGGKVIDILLNEEVIALIESYMDSECILVETNVKVDEAVDYTYFPLHADFSVGWRKSAKSAFSLTAEQLDEPVGVGGAVYLHDTTEGAFCYCEGSHKLKAPRGPNLDDYPADERQEIASRRVRVDGRRGDLVLFDDRGFHGPDQPSRARRTVILLDYYRVETFGRVQVSPMPVWSSDIGRLSPTQLRVLGAGADYMVSPMDYTGTRFKNNPLYPLVAKIIENAYLWQHFKQRLKARIRTNRRG